MRRKYNGYVAMDMLMPLLKPQSRYRGSPLPNLWDTQGAVGAAPYSATGGIYHMYMEYTARYSIYVRRLPDYVCTCIH